jgi:hypothetical protein
MRDRECTRDGATHSEIRNRKAASNVDVDRRCDHGNQCKHIECRQGITKIIDRDAFGPGISYQFLRISYQRKMNVL